MDNKIGRGRRFILAPSNIWFIKKTRTKQFIKTKNITDETFLLKLLFSLKFNIIRPLKDYSNIIFHLELYVLARHERNKMEKKLEEDEFFWYPLRHEIWWWNKKTSSVKAPLTEKLHGLNSIFLSSCSKLRSMIRTHHWCTLYLPFFAASTCNFHDFCHSYGLWFLTFKLVLGEEISFQFQELFFYFTSDKTEKNEKTLVLRLGKTQIVATAADKKTSPVTFVIILLLLLIIMMMGFWKLLLSSLLFIVLFAEQHRGLKKQYGADSFISVNILLVANSEMCRKVFFGNFFRSILVREKSNFSERRRGQHFVWKLSWWRIK